MVPVRKRKLQRLGDDMNIVTAVVSETRKIETRKDVQRL